MIRRWREDEGLSLKEIRQRLHDQGIDVGLSAISVALGRMGVTNRIRYDDWLPWPLERLFHEWMADLADRNLVVAYRPDRGFFYTNPRPGLDGRDGIPVRRPPRDAASLRDGHAQ